MTPEQQAVREWMAKFGQQTPSKPTVPTLEVRQLRARLIFEEALETIAALGLQVVFSDNKVVFEECGKPNLTEIIDGCTDLKVVTEGTLVACGVDGEQPFREVMRSNNSKLWTQEEVDLVALNENPDRLSLWHVGGQNRKWLVKDQYGKVIKSPSYSPANLEEFTR